VVIVGGTFEVEAGRREEFLAGRLDAMRKSRAEPGCLDYTLSADPIDPGRVVLFERWVDQEALDAHLSAMVAAAESPAPGDVRPTAASIMVYDVTGARPLGR
jgi:quinol monooxygenase YgiN